MSKVVWTLAARDDLRRIDLWLERNASGAVAVDTLTTIRARSVFLADFPHGGRPLKDGTRVLRVLGTRYLIQYQLKGREVTVLRVHHEREDWYVAP